MNISLSKAKRLARDLRVLNKDYGWSWRDIARDAYGDKVNFATLNRIAKSKGTWLPKDEGILITLGLKQPCKPKSPPAPIPAWLKQVKKQIAVMAKQTRKDIFIHDKAN